MPGTLAVSDPEPRGSKELGLAETLKREASEKAREILGKHWSGGVPVDPARIARSLGIEVKMARLDPDVSGAIEKLSGGSTRIYLNSSDGRNRQRFTCAHEIGHFVKRGDEGFEYIDYRDGTASMGVDSNEVFANNFAATLLMPAAEVRRLRMDSLGDRELAAVFGVSEAAMVNRLKNLDLYRG